MGGSISVEFHRLVRNDMATVVIWSKSKLEVEFQYGGRLFSKVEIVISQSWIEL